MLFQDSLMTAQFGKMLDALEHVRMGAQALHQTIAEIKMEIFVAHGGQLIGVDRPAAVEIKLAQLTDIIDRAGRIV